jgi:cysteine dioxygenase
VEETTLQEGSAMFIKDSMGYHKIGCPHPNQPAVTLHLYSPPFKSCKIFLDENRKASEANICFYSMYGEKVQQDGSCET